MVAQCTDDIFAFKNYVFNRKEPTNERITALARQPLEVSVDTYLHQHLAPGDEENVLSFKESVLDYCGSKNVPIALLAIGSTTYPLTLMAKALYNDVDIVVLAKEEKDAQSASGKNRFDSRLVRTMEQYLLTINRELGYLLPEKLSIFEVTNRKTVFLPYGRPNTELKREGCVPLHIIVEAYNPNSFDAAKMVPEDIAIITAPTADKIIFQQRRKNLPFSVLHQ